MHIHSVQGHGFYKARLQIELERQILIYNGNFTTTTFINRQIMETVNKGTIEFTWAVDQANEINVGSTFHLTAAVSG